MQSTLLPFDVLVSNKGQLPGLPKNPRFIRDEKFKQLVQSIQDDPEMLDLRELIVFPFQDQYIVIAGNMRFRAMSDLGYKEAPCKILDSSTPVEKLGAYTIKDNNSFGENDWSLLNSDWTVPELETFGMDIPEIEDYSNKNTEINVVEFSNNMVLKFSYSENQYNQVKTKLQKIDENPEKALWKLVNGKA